MTFSTDVVYSFLRVEKSLNHCFDVPITFHHSILVLFEFKLRASHIFKTFTAGLALNFADCFEPVFRQEVICDFYDDKSQHFRATKTVYFVNHIDLKRFVSF